jgi:cytochrome P450
MSDHKPHFADETPIGSLFPTTRASYEELRTSRPVSWNDSHGGFWLVSRYSDVRKVLTYPSRFSSREPLVNRLGAARAARVGAIPLELDPPDHRAYRKLLDDLMAESVPRFDSKTAENIVEEVVRKAPQPDHNDFRNDFAFPLVSYGLSRFVGLPSSDEQWFVENACSFLKSYFKPAPGVSSGRENKNEPLGMGFVGDYVRSRMSTDCASASLSLLDLVTSASWPLYFGTRESEAASVLRNVAEAGLVNTTAMIMNAATHLALNTQDRNVLVANPELAADMMQELLRLYPPHHPARTVRRDVEVAGTKLHIGERVLLLIGSANRDPRVFDRSDEVVLNRSFARHLAFGAGPHWCPGAGLSCLILTAFLARFREIFERYEILIS